jgi:hypothetical protein
MKLTLHIILFSLCTLIMKTSVGQTSPTFMPYNPSYSPLFGKDIIIHNVPEQDQIAQAICSAPNGWIYSTFTYKDTGGYVSRCYTKSTDNGITWDSVRTSLGVMPGVYITKFDLVVNGSDSSNLKLFVAWLYQTEINPPYNCAPYLSRYNAITGEVDDGLFAGDFYSKSDVKLATDYDFPAVGCNPYSLAMIYSKDGHYYSDSLIFICSNNGGMSMNKRRVVDANPHYPEYNIGKVSIAYGYSPSKNTGRYFVAWEKVLIADTSVKQIYTSHTEPNFDSPFTTPVRVDSLDPTMAGRCSNPVIACQVDDIDNDSADFTTMILFDSYSPAANRHKIAGCYNRHSTTSSTFTPFTLTESTHNEVQPDITYNRYTNEFVATYFDSESNMLPCLSQDLNISSPASWEVISEGYNDSPNLTNPKPTVAISGSEHSPAFSWCREGENGNQVAMFDAQFSTYTGFEKKNRKMEDLNLSLFPNPAKTNITVSFDLSQNERVSISLYDMLGRSVGVLENSDFCSGRHSINYDLRNIPEGVYLLVLRTTHETLSKHIILIK